MGGGKWTSDSFVNYSVTTKCASVSTDGVLNYCGTAQDLFTSKKVQSELDPYNAMRECCDSEEHPNTVSVILGIDVTGSMGSTAVEVAKQLNVIMTKLYEKVTDVEFLIMGIGDLYCDKGPIQASQFESDIRIAEQLDKIWFEGGGGGNGYESYTAAWYFGLKHCKLDCWNRGKKGIIITMGDEPLNPYLPAKALNRVTGDSLEGNVETSVLYEKASKKFDIYHIGVQDSRNCFFWYENEIKKSFGKYLDEDHLKEATLDNLASVITNIIETSVEMDNNFVVNSTAGDNSSEGISW